MATAMQADTKVVPFKHLDADGKTRRLLERGLDVQAKKKRAEVILALDDISVLESVYDFVKSLGKLGGTRPPKRKKSLAKIDHDLGEEK
eukprot:12991391-Heterocapsa_arctica.AAC.1